MGSTRLSGKVMKDLCGKTVLAHVIERVGIACKNIVVATTDNPREEPIIAESKKYSADVFQGSEDDVLSRYYLAAKQAQAELVIRITSDCPLYDGRLLAAMLKYYQGEDYLCNTIERRYPRGLDTEIFTFAALEKTYREAKEQHQREHVTPYIYQNPSMFKIRQYKQQPNLSDLRWTLDTEEDWQMIRSVYKALYKDKPFSTVETVKFLAKHPEIANINAHIEQKKLNA